jgi:hypothetical protein
MGVLIEVHRLLGPGLLESTYEVCLCRELLLRGIPFERQRCSHVAQVLTYLKLTELPLAFLVNFNVHLLRDGLRRITNKFPKSFQSSNLPVPPSPRR